MHSSEILVQLPILNGLKKGDALDERQLGERILIIKW